MQGSHEGGGVFQDRDNVIDLGQITGVGCEFECSTVLEYACRTADISSNFLIMTWPTRFTSI